jgi:hypothetical protein
MVMTLSDYFTDVLRRRFAYGDLDCCTFMADWLMRCGLKDPMADRRGTYTSAKQYRAAIRREGGLVASCQRRFFSIGLRETETASSGDVALVMAPIGVRRSGRIAWAPTGAIAVSDKLRAMVTPDAGLVIARANTLLIWEAR